MQFNHFFQSINSSSSPPANSSVYLQAMWYDAKGQWETAHALVDHLTDTTACWVHAYLHRKEGDIGNADYWYRRAGKTRSSFSLQEEWTMLVQALLE